ncbi:MAG: mechanosensitive ion channel [Flavobacteriales bacterium]|nr:mechanosensitive ion channel [Flavobacteriales bacterium]MCC6938140.1 mechanosensitive ion channel [Flavobacteriales bacterium]
MPVTRTLLSYSHFIDAVGRLLERTGLDPEHIVRVSTLIGIATVFMVMGLLSKGLTYVIAVGLKRFARRTITQFDDHLLGSKVHRYVARVIPLILSYHLIPVVFSDHPEMVVPVERLFNIFFIVLFIRIVRAFMRAGRDTLKDNPTYRDKPLDSYLQIITLVMYLIAAILIFSQLTGKSAWAFLTAMGAASAVLLLIFKDTILGFVASIQISANDMLRLGDWITVDKYGADGDVTEINLTTVKVTNFDKTITTIPTYALIADSFQNWRGMQESGGRRIKRAILIKVSSIRYLSEGELDELRRIQLLTGFIDERRAEIAKSNAERNVDASMPVNGRRITNVGLYRKYADLYLANHPGIHQHMTRIVRQQAPHEHGLPLELVCFTNTVESLAYEGIMADIFDHLLVAHRYFHLTIFERPAADDMRNMGKPLEMDRG